MKITDPPLARIMVRRVLPNSFRGWVFLILGYAIFGNLAVAEDPLGTATKLRIESQREAVASQKRIDDIAEETQASLEEYRQLVQRGEDLRAYNDYLERLANDQNRGLLTLRKELNTAQQIQQQIEPLLSRMVDVLDRFVVLDMPFLLEERRLRLDNLQMLVNDLDVALAEKYRRIMEAYQIEMGYGRTIEAYTGDLILNGKTRTVEYLRIGRVALLYRTLDGREAGYWDKPDQQWRGLPTAEHAAIARGLRIAKKELPPDLIPVPLPAPETTE
jgi:hypothetical protein